MIKKIQFPLRLSVSFLFLFLLLRKMDLTGIRAAIEALKNCRTGLALAAISISVMLAFGLALRLLIILKSQASSDKITYPNMLKLTFVGLFFNNFLPTGAGGDIAKAIFLARGEKKKLMMGGSVLVDRFLGAMTVISMGTVSAWLTPDIPIRYRTFLSLIMLIILFTIMVFSSRKTAGILYRLPSRIIPCAVKARLEAVYATFSSYFSSGRDILKALAVSLSVQTLSIISNYVMGVSLDGGRAGLGTFFTYIPLIWTSTLIPSLGGLGVREFTYVYFFSRYMGEEKAAALSMLVLLAILIQSAIGGITLLFLRMPSSGRKNSPL